MRDYFRSIGLLMLLLLIASCQPGSYDNNKETPQDTQIQSIDQPNTRYLESFDNATTDWMPGLPPSYSDSSAKAIEIIAQGDTTGGNALSIKYDKDSFTKAIYYIEKTCNLASQRYLNFTLLNLGSLNSVAIAISTGDNWLWQESPQIQLATGKNAISFDLEASYFKTAATSWQPISRLENLGDTRRLAVIVYPVLAGEAYLDAISLSDTPLGKGVVAITILPTPTAVPTHPVNYLKINSLTTVPQVYRKVEIAIETDGAFLNPFDPAEVDLRINYTSPTGQAFTVPAFWYQDYDPQTLAAIGEPGWRARFTPTAPGEWQVQAELVGQKMKSEPLQITAVSLSADAPFAHGFLRRNPVNKNYLAYDDGTTFFGVGLNLGWSTHRPFQDYLDWLDRLSANGGNLIRVWMASWSFGIEWSDTGLGNYTRRLDRAFQLDQVFELAEQRGIAIELVLINHGAFSESVNAEWKNNPYNTINGGMCAKPECFATDLQARQYFERRLRYIVARYSYSPALLAWEWWNEANWTPIFDTDMAAWIKAMTPTIQAYDPQAHLISTSYAANSTPLVNKLQVIDFAQLHLYSSADPATAFPELYRRWTKDIPGKPVLFAEYGVSTTGEDNTSHDRQGLRVHNGLWAATFSGFASGAMYWWWDSYVDPLYLWPVYGRLAEFLKGTDLALLKPGSFTLTEKDVSVLVLQDSHTALAWLHDRKYEIGAMENQYYDLTRAGNPPGADWIYRTDPIQGLDLAPSGLIDGAYAVRWYLPSEGRWLAQTTSFTIANGIGLLPVPNFSGDIALKIDPETP